ncbi:MAG: hypothetical protein M3Y56_05520 [Armatimonadota bacterium]|nr:hypothetical protein [Armatimonadota bacterium]
MTKFRIEFDWQDPQGAKGPELRATWADLKIIVGDEVITTVVNDKSRSTRDTITLPLYPLTEWMATHWWSLLYEQTSPGRPSQDTYEERHCLRFAREGYALPGLCIRPLGNSILFEWSPLHLSSCGVRFIKGGWAGIPLKDVRESLGELIESVLGRLQEHQIGNTLLFEEWNTIQNADEDETDFCIAAARLGLDPYNLDKQQQNAITQAAEKVPASILDDFFSVAESNLLPYQSTSLLGAIESTHSQSYELPDLLDLRRQLPKPSAQAPWDQGYEFARSLRTLIHQEERGFESIEEIGEALHMEPNALNQSIIPTPNLGFLDGLLAINQKGSPGFLVTRRNEASKRYTFCRILFEWLNSSGANPAIVSRVRSDRQQRNRAFAAEFLAPAKLVQERISGSTISDDEVNDLAEDFHVSDYVIRHQIENHHLATVISSDNHFSG